MWVSGILVPNQKFEPFPSVGSTSLQQDSRSPWSWNCIIITLTQVYNYSYSGVVLSGSVTLWMFCGEGLLPPASRECKWFLCPSYFLLSMRPLGPLTMPHPPVGWVEFQEFYSAAFSNFIESCELSEVYSAHSLCTFLFFVLTWVSDWREWGISSFSFGFPLTLPEVSNCIVFVYSKGIPHMLVILFSLKCLISSRNNFLWHFIALLPYREGFSLC